MAGQELRSKARNGRQWQQHALEAGRVQVEGGSLEGLLLPTAHWPCLCLQLQAFQDKDLPLVSFTSFNKMVFI